MIKKITLLFVLVASIGFKTLHAQTLPISVQLTFMKSYGNTEVENWEVYENTYTAYFQYDIDFIYLKYDDKGILLEEGFGLSEDIEVPLKVLEKFHSTTQGKVFEEIKYYRIKILQSQQIAYVFNTNDLEKSYQYVIGANQEIIRIQEKSISGFNQTMDDFRIMDF